MEGTSIRPQGSFVEKKFYDFHDVPYNPSDQNFTNVIIVLLRFKIINKWVSYVHLSSE